MDWKKRFGTLLVMLAITLACVPVLPSVALLPTQPVDAVDTRIAGTYAAASSATAVNITFTPTQTGTPTATQTATITPTPTATFILKTPTMFFSAGGGGGGGGSSGGGSGGGGSSGGGGGGFEPTYTCRIVKITPASGSHLTHGDAFQTIWRVLNTGNMVWDHNSVDYKYASGTPMHIQSLYDLPINVAPRKQVDLVVDMQVPNTPGTYITTWVMQVGHDVFCSLKQKIIAD